jgi:hypothetical protein
VDEALGKDAGPDKNKDITLRGRALLTTNMRHGSAGESSVIPTCQRKQYATKKHTMAELARRCGGLTKNIGRLDPVAEAVRLGRRQLITFISLRKIDY